MLVGADVLPNQASLVMLPGVAPLLTNRRARSEDNFKADEDANLPCAGKKLKISFRIESPIPSPEIDEKKQILMDILTKNR